MVSTFRTREILKLSDEVDCDVEWREVLSGDRFAHPREDRRFRTVFPYFSLGSLPLARMNTLRDGGNRY